jgi:iron complex transport system substrate-binding protein
MKSYAVLSAMLLVLLIMAGCGSNQNEESSNPPVTGQQSVDNQESVEEYTPITITNLDYETTYTEKPQRVVSLATETTEILLKLGLGDRIVAAIGKPEEALPELKDQFSRLNILSDGARYPSLEAVIGADPDFIYARANAFNGTNAIGTVSDLEAQYEIKSYMVKSTSAPQATMELVYEDIMNIGKIFQIEDRASDLVASLKKDVETIQNKIGQVDEPVKVMFYDSGDTTSMWTAGNQLASDLLSRVGGINIFGDIPKNWSQVNWEEVVNRNPDVIIVFDYGNESAQSKIDLIKNQPAMKDVAAVVNDRFIVTKLANVMEGIRNITAMEDFAKGLYPDKMRD